MKPTALLIAMLTGLFCSGLRAQAPPPLPDESVWKKLPPHPRLFASSARFGEVKGQTDEVSGQLRALILHEADQKLGAPPITYPTTGMRLEEMREVLSRVPALAMAYRLSGERRYFERARQEMLQLAALPTWNPSHFLDVAEATLAAGIGLDWLHDDLTPEEREQIARAIVTNALRPSLEVPVGGNSWMNADFNWNQVCNAGLTVGALSVFERDPALARRVIERAITSLPYAGATYAPDGTYAEGASYWAYGTTFHVVMVEALRSAFGTSFDLEKPPGFLRTTDFMTQIVAPSGEEYNYSDHNGQEARAVSEPIMLWFAREQKSRDCARDELKNISALAAKIRTQQPIQELSRHLPMELLWWNPALPLAGRSMNLPLHWTAGGKLPLAVMRSAWNDPLATYLAVKGGTPDGSHAHMDVGSFVLETDGVRWAQDLGKEEYDQMRKANIDLWNYTQDSSRWTVFRVGPEGHNILRFNGARQDVSGRAEIRALPDDHGTVGDTVELSSLYKSQVERVQREVRLFPDRSVSVVDRWTAGERETAVAWQWLTTAKVTRTANGIRLVRVDKSLELKIESTAKFEVQIEDVSLPASEQDSPNPGLSRIVIRLNTPAQQTDTLSVKATPGRITAGDSSSPSDR